MSLFGQHPTASGRKERFYGGYTWLVLKNAIGWIFLLLAFVAGPLVPGPGGIPLFLIGFALISFPGKRKLTARVLRGRRIALNGRTLVLVIPGVSLTLPTLASRIYEIPPEWLWEPLTWGPLAFFVTYLLGVLLVALTATGGVLLMNLLLRAMPPVRRRVRPWLRHHHIRLLPPRYRRRMSHEQGTGPVRIKGEIISFLR